jgi:hypothetical protein
MGTKGGAMTTASLTISIIAILIVCVLAWNAFGGKDDASRDDR